MGLVKPSSKGMTINGIINSYTVQAGNNINAGDFVDFINGQVASHKMYSSPKQSFIGNNYNNSTYAVSPITACKINSTQVLIGFIMNNTAYVEVCTFNGSAISMGGLVSVTALGAQDLNYVKLKLVNSTTAIIFVQNSGQTNSYFIYNLTGSITISSYTNAESRSLSGYYLETYVNNNQAVIVYTAGNYIYARAGTIGGTGTALTITWGTEVLLATVGSTALDIADIQCYDPVNNYFIIGTYTGGNLYLLTFSVTGANVINLLNSQANAHGGTMDNMSIIFKVVSSSLVFVFYYDSTNKRIAYMPVSIINNVASAGQEVIILSSQILMVSGNKTIYTEPLISNYGSNYFLLSFEYASYQLGYMILSVTPSNGIQLQTSTPLLLGVAGISSSPTLLFSLTTDEFFIVYQQSGSSGNASVGVNTITEQKFGVATTAGAAGTTINVAV